MSAVATGAVCAAFAPLAGVWGLWLATAVAAAPHHGDPPLPEGALPTLDVLIPAHDEELLLPRLLDALGRDRTALGRVLVVADHCSDGTAAIAAGRGAHVLARDEGPRGKPAALRAGLAALAAMPHRGAGVIVLDADCVPEDGFVRRMAGVLRDGASAAQGAYLMSGGAGDDAVAAAGLGVLLKNVVRPTGQHRLGIPTQLLGTGMLFRADVLDLVEFRDDLVEDVRMSHDLLDAGIAVRFVPEARVSAPMASDRGALTQQRMRWEGGQMSAIRTGMRLAATRLRRGRVREAAALIDWSAPPLAMAVGAWAAGTAATGVLVAAGVVPARTLAAPAVTAATLGAYLTVGVGAALGPRAVLRLAVAAPRFLGWKAGVYMRLAGGDTPRAWARTPRGHGASERTVAR